MSDSLVAEWPSTQLSPVEAVERCLDRIERCEGSIHAWAHIDAAQARRDAQGMPVRPDTSLLHAMPIGVKDTIDVSGLPCERGSLAYRGRMPTQDAGLVTRLRDAGAIIVGKTVTTELAVVRPGATRNPWNTSHTPGGSSSGSAAAVAAGMVPAAIGTQTIASTLRPASFCGVVGYKPSHARVPLDGVLAMSPSVDSVGILAGSVDIAESVTRALDRNTTLFDSGRRSEAVRSVSFQPTPWWSLAEGASAAAVSSVRSRLRSTGVDVVEAEAPVWFEDLLTVHWTIVRAGISEAMSREPEAVQQLFGDELQEIRRIHFESPHVLGGNAERTLSRYRMQVDELFGGSDFICSPCVTGEAPDGLAWTGDPIFCQPWSALGLPAISIPVGLGPNGLPVGVQIVGRLNDDYNLLSFARGMFQDQWQANNLN